MKTKICMLLLSAMMAAEALSGCGNAKNSEQSQDSAVEEDVSEADKSTAEDKEKTDVVAIHAAEAVLDGVVLKDTDDEKEISYSEEHDCIIGLGEFSSAKYTVPSDIDGNYDIYLEISKGASAFVCGSSPMTVSINGEDISVPSLAIKGCTMDQMGIKDSEPSYMDDMGIFQIKEDAILKGGDIITIGGVAGYEFYFNDAYAISMPAIGAMMLYPSGTAVEMGYTDEKFLAKSETKENDDPISGLEIAWLGSSVTYGQQGGGYSMADEIAAKHMATNCYKYAISGTTLADCKTENSVPTDGEGSHSSYVARLKQLDKNKEYDLFIVQLSTNDATAGIEIGNIAKGKELNDFDATTVTGAMEYIIKYVSDTWGCPVMFYTGVKYDSPEYENMVNILFQLKEKWNIGVIDLWNNEKMNAVTKEDYEIYMADSIHPTKKGYAEWWTPVFEEAISSYL